MTRSSRRTSSRRARLTLKADSPTEIAQGRQRRSSDPDSQGEAPGRHSQPPTAIRGWTTIVRQDIVPAFLFSVDHRCNKGDVCPRRACRDFLTSILLLYFITDSWKGNGKDHHHAGINGFCHRLPDDTALRTISASLFSSLQADPSAPSRDHAALYATIREGRSDLGS